MEPVAPSTAILLGVSIAENDCEYKISNFFAFSEE